MMGRTVGRGAPVALLIPCSCLQPLLACLPPVPSLSTPAHATACSIQQRRLGMPLGQTLLGKSVLVVGFGNIANELIVR